MAGKRRSAFVPALVAALALLLLLPACGNDVALPVDDPGATEERLQDLRLRSWDLPGSFRLAGEGVSHNDEVASRSTDPNRRLDEFTRWGRVVGFSQEFRAGDRLLAVRYLTVVYRTDDGARQSFEATPSVFQAVDLPLNRMEVSVSAPLGEETRGYRLVYDPDGDRAEGHYITWRRGRVVMSAQTWVLDAPADQAEAEELAGALDRRFTESGVH
jgi:hypothetical protein